MRCRSSSDRVIEILLLFFSYYIRKAVSQIGNVVITIKPYVMNCYIKTEINSDNITKIKVVETIESVIPLRNKELTRGSGVITHIGAYKRFKFEYDNKLWFTEPGNRHAITNDKSEAICMDYIEFPHNDLEQHWHDYIHYNGNKKPSLIECKPNI